MIMGLQASHERHPSQLIEVSLPPEAAEYLVLLKNAWGNDPRADLEFKDDLMIPYAKLDSSHGRDIGHVVENRKKQEFDPEDPKHIFSIDSRLSYGTDNGFREAAGRKDEDWVPSDSERLHISLRASRTFVPEDEPHRMTTEQLLFSLRWIDGVFDDWSDPSLYGQGGRQAYPVRSTHTMLFPTSSRNERTNAMREKVGTSPKLLDHKGRVIGFDGEVHVADMYNEPQFPGIVSYDQALYLLSRVGDIDLDGRVNDLTPMEGVEFLLGQVLPAMESFCHYSNG